MKNWYSYSKKISVHLARKYITVLDGVDIKTESEVSTLNRDLSRAREITKKSKTHVRVFTPIASLATLKEKGQEMREQFARIPAYFKPNTVEHYQAQVLSKELEVYQKQGLSTAAIQEKLRDQKTLAEIAQRGNQAFLEQYFVRTGSRMLPTVQKDLDKGLTPHFETGQDGEKVLRFAEPQHITIEADKRGKLNLVVQLGEKPQIKPAPQDKTSLGVPTSVNSAKPKPEKAKPPASSAAKEGLGSSRSSESSHSDNPFRLHHSGLGLRSRDGSQAFGETFGSSVERKYNSETDEMMALGLDENTPISFRLGGSHTSKQASHSALEQTLDFLIPPTHAEPSFREEIIAEERRKDLLFGFTAQHSRSGPAKGLTFGNSLSSSYSDKASVSKDHLVMDQRQRLEKLSGFVGEREQSFAHPVGQRNERGERSHIKPAPQGKASSSVGFSTPTSSSSTQPKPSSPASKASDPKQRIALTKPFSTEQRDTLVNAVVGKMREQFNRQGYFVSESTLQAIAVEQLSHCHSMQDVMRLGARLQEQRKGTQFGDGVPRYVQASHSLSECFSAPMQPSLFEERAFSDSLLGLLSSLSSRNQQGKQESSSRSVKPGDQEKMSARPTPFQQFQDLMMKTEASEDTFSGCPMLSPEEYAYGNRMMGETLAQTVIGVADIPYDLASILGDDPQCVPKYYEGQPAFSGVEPPSKKIERFLADRDIDLHQAPPRNDGERFMVGGLKLATECVMGAGGAKLYSSSKSLLSKLPKLTPGRHTKSTLVPKNSFTEKLGRLETEFSQPAFGVEKAGGRGLGREAVNSGAPKVKLSAWEQFREGGSTREIFKFVKLEQLERVHALSGKGSTNYILKLRDDMIKYGFDITNPFEVVYAEGRYYIVDGHHRYHAARMAGIKKIPIKIIEDIENHPSSWNSVEEVLKDAAERSPDRLRFK